MTTMEKHATSDIWEAAAMWALGAALSHTERDGDRVVFVFAAGLDYAEASQLHRRGQLDVKSLAMRQGIYEMRSMLDQSPRDDGGR